MTIEHRTVGRPAGNLAFSRSSAVTGFMAVPAIDSPESRKDPGENWAEVSKAGQQNGCGYL